LAHWVSMTDQDLRDTVCFDRQCVTSNTAVEIVKPTVLDK